MATISKSGISTNSTIQAEHITRVIDALDGTTSNDILVDNISIGDTNITGSTQTTLVFQNSISQSLSGVIYSKTDQVKYAAADESDVNLLSGSTSTIFGSANLPTSFFSSSPNYKSKILSFSVKGQLDSNSSDELVTYVGINNEGTVTKLFENTVELDNSTEEVPMEILGEIFINDRMAYPCISIRYCRNDDFRAFPLSNLFAEENISSLEGGEFGFYVSSSSTIQNITGSIGHIEIKN